MKQSTYGAIYVDSKASAKEFTDEDLAMFEAVTNYLALVIENARLAEELFRKEEESRLSLEKENVRLRQALESRAHLIGECPQMKSLYEIVKKVAPTDATVLISGESGTGKEVMAHILHDLSNRNKSPFVAVDCAAIPETLLESELFGHEKGAFTGAIAQKLGKLELANSGTLFLDEIGDMSLTLQTKLLRVMQEREIVRVGGTASVKIDIRIITATNKDLPEMVSKGQFRQELYFRLNVVTIKLPPLRERANDIKLLAEYFLKDINIAQGRTIECFTLDAEELMLRHRWPGNIRELKHRIEQAVILSDIGKKALSAEDLGLKAKGFEEFEFSQFEEAKDKFERQLIQNALLNHKHNVTHTAKSLGLSRQHLQNLIKKYGIAK